MAFRGGEVQALLAYASRYSYPDEEAARACGQRVQAARALTIDDLRVLAQWKSPRIGAKIDANDPAFLADVSRAVFLAQHPQARIEFLCVLHGVDYPMASAILHWVFPQEFALIDYRALWSLGVDTPPQAYRYAFYERYNAKCLSLAVQLKRDLRTVDRGLWQYSKEHQPAR